MAMEQLLTEAWEWFLANERSLVLLITIFMYVIGTIVYFILLYFPAMYGRYTNAATGLLKFHIPARTAWFIQEVRSP